MILSENDSFFDNVSDGQGGLLVFMRNIPKWSATSLSIIPDSFDLQISFVYMWSIRVADEGIILVGLIMSGIKSFSKNLSTQSFVFSCNVF